MWASFPMLGGKEGRSCLSQGLSGSLEPEVQGVLSHTSP